MVLFASMLVRVGSLPLGQHGIFDLLAKLHPPSITIKLKVSFAQSSAGMPDPERPWNPPPGNRTYEQGGDCAADSAQSPSSPAS